jgi:hypothetical protein
VTTVQYGIALYYTVLSLVYWNAMQYCIPRPGCASDDKMARVYDLETQLPVASLQLDSPAAGLSFHPEVHPCFFFLLLSPTWGFIGIKKHGRQCVQVRNNQRLPVCLGCRL